MVKVLLNLFYVLMLHEFKKDIVMTLRYSIEIIDTHLNALLAN